MIKTISDVKNIVKKDGYTSIKAYDDIFLNKDNLEYGITFSEDDGTVNLESISLYNAEITDLVYYLWGEKKPKSTAKIIGQSYSTDIFYFNGDFYEDITKYNSSEFLDYLNYIHRELVIQAANLDDLYELSIRKSQYIIKNEIRYQYRILEVLTHICIIKKKYMDAMEYCNLYFYLRGEEPDFGNATINITYKYLESKLTDKYSI